MTAQVVQWKQRKNDTCPKNTVAYRLISSWKWKRKMLDSKNDWCRWHQFFTFPHTPDVYYEQSEAENRMDFSWRYSTFLFVFPFDFRCVLWCVAFFLRKKDYVFQLKEFEPVWRANKWNLLLLIVYLKRMNFIMRCYAFGDI